MTRTFPIEINADKRIICNISDSNKSSDICDGEALFNQMFPLWRKTSKNARKKIFKYLSDEKTFFIEGCEFTSIGKRPETLAPCELSIVGNNGSVIHFSEYDTTIDDSERVFSKNFYYRMDKKSEINEDEQKIIFPEYRNLSELENLKSTNHHNRADYDYLATDYMNYPLIIAMIIRENFDQKIVDELIEIVGNNDLFDFKMDDLYSQLEEEIKHSRQRSPRPIE